MAEYKLSHTAQEIDSKLSDIDNKIDISKVPLHYNFIVTLDYLDFDNLKNGGVYTNSFVTSHFSRTPHPDDLFSLIFIDNKQRKIYTFAKITAEPNDKGLSSFTTIPGAILLDDPTALEGLTNSFNALKTEDWTFIVDNGDNTTSTITKQVYVK